ncbi:DUF885 domain-containing protein [Phenylobacterium sp.]|uniref:DUF885 domain-containing protein n=1 Tax=Phenylobacterium sp. TaxID=1871053 RepID=UPI00286A277B|nr:DUF885 domain-containing protein [Phenylobacterium sp.]
MTHISLTRRGAAAFGLAAIAAPAFATSPADVRFARLAAAYVDQIPALSPSQATVLGDHRFDGQVDDMSAAGRRAREDLARRFLARAERFRPAELSRENQVDLALLKNQLRYDIWTDEVLQSWAWDPQLYAGVAGNALYSLMAREFAPLPARLRSVISRMQALPALYAQMREQLQPARVPLIHAQTVAKQNAGVLSILDGMVLPAASALPPSDQARLKAAAQTLRAAVAEQQTWLDTVLVPAAKGDFRLGSKLYDQKLAFALVSPMSRAEIRAAADAALKQTRAEMYGVSRRVLAGRAGVPPMPEAPDAATQQKAIEAALELAYADHPPRDGVVPACRAALAAATDFVRARDLITLPDAPVEAIIMPEYARGAAVAYCDAPGPLDRGQKTYVDISPIPDDWTPAQAESFLREYNRRGLNDTMIHEAMPGHFVQIWHSNKHPSVLRALLGSGPFIEGWAVYAEDMMAKQGYLDGDPLFRLQQLKTRVRSITNAILDQMVHVDGAGEAEVMAFLTVTAFQQEREAAGKWTRARLDSTQLPSYFVGAAEHDSLRAEAERRQGAAFDLKRYHDKVLSYGSPPSRYVRALMFGGSIG